MTFMKSTAAGMALVFAISTGATIVTGIQANAEKALETDVAVLTSGYATPAPDSETSAKGDLIRTEALSHEKTSDCVNTVDTQWDQADRAYVTVASKAC